MPKENPVAAGAAAAASLPLSAAPAAAPNVKPEGLLLSPDVVAAAVAPNLNPPPSLLENVVDFDLVCYDLCMTNITQEEFSAFQAKLLLRGVKT